MSVTNEPQNADRILQRFGYQPQFRRELKHFASFAIGFSFISITTGIFSAYGTVLNSSGPLGIWTWPMVVIGQLFVALVFGALVSRIPLAGYSYQWMSRLATPQVGWLIGWVSFTFLIVNTVSVDYAIASTVLPSLFNYTATNVNVWITTAIVILIQLVLLAFSTPWSTRVNNAAVGTEVLGILGLMLLLLIVGTARGLLHPDHLFSMGTVSPKGYFNPGGLFSTGPFMFAFLLGAYTIIGFESSANLAEETQEAHRVIPFTMGWAVALSGIVGFAFLIALNLTSGNLKALAASATPVADIVNGVLGHSIGSLFLVIVTFSIFACGLVIFLTATRLAWAMSRDERFPGYQLFRRVNPRTGTPLASTVLMGLLCELVLAVFAGLGIFANQTATLLNLFSVAALLPTIIYLSTVIFYAIVRRHLPPSQGFSLGSFEWPIIVLAIVWLVYELLIFRDASFVIPWLYCVVTFVIGLLYFGWMLLRRPKVLKTVPMEAEGELSAESDA